MRSCASAGSPSRRSSRSSRPLDSSTTATSSSTRSRQTTGRPRARLPPRAAAGTRCCDRGVLARRATSATGSATRCATGRARRSSPPTTRRTDAGYLRHLVVREGRNTGQALVQLVTATGEKFERAAARRGAARVPEVRSIHWAVNDTPAEVTNLPTALLWGEECDRGGDPRAALPRAPERVPPDEHRDGRAALRARARVAGLTGSETVYDLYCGIGTIGLSLARRRADGVGGRDLRGVGRVRDRERRAERDHERGVLRRQRRRWRSRNCASAPARPTSSSSIRRVPGSPGRRSAGSARLGRRGSSTSRATRRRLRAT